MKTRGVRPCCDTDYNCAHLDDCEVHTAGRPATLAGFLLARIAEDEIEATNKGGDRPGADGFYTWVGRLGAHGIGVTSARVLGECEAKRQIVAMHDRDGDHCVMCSREDPRGCPTLRVLAAVYADHPDYRAEWTVA